MFTSIAPRYDLLNHVLSLNIDRLWWNKTARAFAGILSRPEAQVLDFCCGTGDMTLALRRQAGKSPRTSWARTFPTPCCSAPAAKPQARRCAGSKPTPCACLFPTPFRPDHFRLRLSQPGQLRRWTAGDHACPAPRRRIRHSGFRGPQGLVGNCYRIYFKRVLPAIGTLISGVKGPYAYLPASVARFPPPHEMLQRIRQAGFRVPSWTPYTLGIAGLYRGRK